MNIALLMRCLFPSFIATSATFGVVLLLASLGSTRQQHATHVVETVHRGASESEESVRYNRNERPHHAHLRLNDRVLIDQPGFHMSRPRFSPDKRFLAVALIPTGAETAHLGQVVLIDAERATVVGYRPGSAVRWAPAPILGQFSEIPSHVLEIEHLLANDSTVITRHRMDQILRHPRTETSSKPLRVAPEFSFAEKPPHSSRPILSSARFSTAFPTYPEAIRVIHHRLNECRDLEVGHISIVPFEEYVARVLPAEVPTSWEPAALEAQAVAVRTYAWYQIQLGRPEYDVSDFANFQMMCDARYPTTDAAVEATKGLYLSALGDEMFRPILAMYSAENGHPTFTSETVDQLQSVADLYSLGKVRNGHGYGLSQWGAQRRALAGHTASQILSHYYSHIHLRDGQIPTQTVVSLSQPLSSEEINTSSIRWEVLTSHADLFQESFDRENPGAAPRIRITASRPITRQQVITWVGTLTRTEVITTEEGMSRTVVISETLVQTDAQQTAGPLFFASQTGIWPLPANLQDGDVITLQLRLSDTVLAQSRLTLDQSAPSSPEAVVPPVTEEMQFQVALTSPPDGPVGVNVGWSWPGENLLHTPDSGALITDGIAVGGKSWWGISGQHREGVWYGPYTTTVKAGESYRALFWLRIDEIPVEDVERLWLDEIIARLDVTDDEGRRVLGLRDVRRSDFGRHDTYSPIAVDFHLFEPPRGLEFRVAWRGSHTLALDGIELWTLPRAVGNGQVELDVGRGFGDRTIQFASFDLAGNIGKPFTQAIHARDLVPPQLEDVIAPSVLPAESVMTATVNSYDPFSGLDPERSVLVLQPILSGVEGVAENLATAGEGQILTATARLSFAENPWVRQTLVFTLPAVPEAQYDAHVRVNDRAGNQSATARWSLLVAEDPFYKIWLPVVSHE